ncbi:MAG: hypothetical protein ACJ78U_14340 [Myxococcales bacterium]
MKSSGATIGGLLLTTLMACGGLEPTPANEIGAPAGRAASTLSSDCTGLVPGAVPSGFSTVVGLSDACAPMGATSDGLGNYSVGKTCGGSGFEIWNVVDATGTRHPNNIFFRTTFDPKNERDERHVLPQPDGGFLAFHWDTESTSSGFHRVVALRAYDGDGAQTGEHLFIDLMGATGDSFPDRSWSIAPVISGGAQVTHVSLPGDGTWHLSTQRYSQGASALQGVQQLATAPNLSITPQKTLTGVATGGQALIAWDNGTQGRAVWTDATGHLVGGTFALPFRVDKNTSVSPLLDGTLAFDQAGDWEGAIAPGSHTMLPAPSWLSTRPGSSLFLVPGGRAHALFTRAPGACQAHFVIFAPAGNRCGAVDLPSADADGCAFTAEVGRDGTVVVQGHTQFSETGDFPTQSVTQRFYPQLLR